MPIKTLKKIFWTINGVLCVLLFFSIGLIFAKKKEIYQSIDISTRKKNVTQRKYTISDYRAIWRTNLGKKVVRKVVKIQSDWHEKFLRRNVVIKAIHSKNYAIVKVRGQEQSIEPYAKGKQTVTNRGRKVKPWELRVSGQIIIVNKIVPGMGIWFRFPQVGKTLLLKDTNAPKFFKNSPSTSKQGIRKAGENHVLVTPEEGEKILGKADSYIEEISPKVEYDRNGNPYGIKIRRVIDNSKAHQLGLREGDVIMDVNGSRTNSLNPAYIQKLIQRHQRNSRVYINILRQGRRVRIRLDVKR